MGRSTTRGGASGLFVCMRWCPVCRRSLARLRLPILLMWDMESGRLGLVPASPLLPTAPLCTRTGRLRVVLIVVMSVVSVSSDSLCQERSGVVTASFSIPSSLNMRGGLRCRWSGRAIGWTCGRRLPLGFPVSPGCGRFATPKSCSCVST